MIHTPKPLEEAVLDDIGEFTSLEPLTQRASEHNNASDTLEESEASYRSLFEFNPHPIWICDDETLRFLLVNDAATVHYGYSHEEFLAMTIKDIRPAEDVPLLLDVKMSHLPENGKLGVWRHKKRDGEIIDVEITVRKFRYRGRPARLTLVNDITERLRAELALRQLAERLEKERERLAEAQTVAKVGSWEFDLTTKLLTWSEETYRIFGMDQNTFGASHEAFLQRVHPDDRAAVDGAYTESVANRTPYAIDHRMLMADGSVKILHERCHTVYNDADGRPLRSIGTVQDITERKQTEQVLHHIMEGAHCLLWQAEVTEIGGIDGLQWKMQFANEPANQRFLPLKVTEGKEYNDAWHHARPVEDRVRINHYGNQEIRAGRSYQQEFRSFSKEGVLYWLSENVRVETLGEGKWRCTGVCTDITERKLAEEATRALTRGAQCLLWYAFVEEQPHGLHWEIDTADEEAAQQFFPLLQSPGQSYTEAWGRSRMPEDSEAMYARSTEAIIGGQPGYTQQFRCLRADGEWRWMNETVRIEALTPGRWKCVGVCTDVTELKETEQKLTRSLDLLRAVTEGTTNAIYAKDIQGRYLMINTIGAHLVGKTPEEILGQDDTTLFSPEIASRIQETDRRTMQSGETHTEEIVSVAAGAMRTYQSTKGPLRDHSGNIIGVVDISRDITTRKQTEQALQHMMEGAHCLLWQAEVEEIGEEYLQWKQQLASDQAAQCFLPLHVTAEQDYKTAWYLSRPVEDRERTDRYGTQEIRAGRSYQQEFRSYSKDGTLHWLSENVGVEALGEGKWRCVGVCTDITERKLAEEATRALTRGAQCLLWYASIEEQSHGLNWEIEIPDEEAAQQFFPVLQPPGQSYTDAWGRSRLPEDSEAMDTRSIKALLGGETGYTQQFRCLRADGEWRWLNEVVRIEALTPGRWKCVGVCTDVTEQKRAEEERDRFFTLSLDLLCVADINGYLTRLNPAFETVMGFTQAELMAHPMMYFVHPEDREGSIAEVTRLYAGSPTRNFENRCLCANGSYRWLSWTAIAYQGSLYAAAHDITPIKEAEAALRKANEELEGRVADRTAEITQVNAQLTQTNTQLLTAKQEADRANHAKSEFLSRMSHELRTPLNAILGFGQILDKERLTPLQEESVQYILKGGRHLLDLINEVLDIARVEAGHIELSLEPIPLQEILAEACSLVRPLATERQILLDATPCDGSHVLADRQRLKQVLINLLSNAIKYNRTGGHVSVRCLPGPDHRLGIAVHDTGPGITPEEQQKLFTPFERLNAARSGVEGTGLGLVLSQRLVMAMGGKLLLESIPGEGSTFTIELPLVLSPMEKLEDQIPEVGTEQAGQHHATILTIEDNLSNLRLMEVLLRSRPGITLLAAMQGGIGLDLARQHEPDLILLDLNLPDISGKEVLARLQASALTRDIPVIVLSADATPAQIERLLGAGARAYLTKPLEVEEFLSTLDTMLLNKQVNPSPGQEIII